MTPRLEELALRLDDAARLARAVAQISLEQPLSLEDASYLLPSEYRALLFVGAGWPGDVDVLLQPMASVAQAKGTFGAPAVRARQTPNAREVATRYCRRGWRRRPTAREPATDPTLSMVESRP